jgi:hypothetical protein
MTPFLISPKGEKMNNKPLPPWGKVGMGVWLYLKIVNIKIF